MPTVFRENGFDFRIYFNDHSPPHVHALKAEGEIKISIEGKIPYLLSNDRMKLKDIRQALLTVERHQAKLLAYWREIHE
jgi:hypothetical protein